VGVARLDGEHLLEQAVDLGVDLVTQVDVVVAHLVGQLFDLDVLLQVLAHLEAGADLIGQPGGDGGATGGSRVLRVVHDVLLDHGPVLAAEPKSTVNVSKHEVGGVAVLDAEGIEVGGLVLFLAPIDQVLMAPRSVLPHLEQVLSQLVAWVLDTKRAVNTGDHTVLSACLTTERKWRLRDTLVQNSIREDVRVTGDTHDEGAVPQVILGVRFLPHCGK